MAGATITQTRGLLRRSVLKAAVGVAALPLCHIRTAGAAGKLSFFVYSHFVPGFDDVLKMLLRQWAEQNKVDVQADLVSAQTYHLLPAEEAQAGSGHDFWGADRWDVHAYANQLEPVDDVVARLSDRYGAVTPVTDYLANVEGSYRGVPAERTSVAYSSDSRIDLFKKYVGMDLQAVFPVATEMGQGYDAWTWNSFLVAAEKCANAGYPFGLTMAGVPDGVSWLGALFRGFGAELVDAEGTITARSDNVRKVLDYARRLMRFVPPDVYSWDDASNNRALISGKSALIFNPPSAWAVAVRDNLTVGEQIWHHPLPAGEHGRYVPFAPGYWCVWKFSKNKSAAKDLIEWLGQREQVERLVVASRGYDIPPFISMSDFPVWAEEGPPKGTLFNYPLKPQHHAELAVAGWPAPPRIGAQMFTQGTMPKLVARVTQSGMPIEQSISLAEQELEGFMR
jgi:hypothetical protein